MEAKMNLYKLLYSKTHDVKSIERLAEEFATCNLYIPKKIKVGHYLSLYNKDFCKVLEENFGGKVIYIPVLKRLNDIVMDTNCIDTNVVNTNTESILYKIKSLILQKVNQ